VITANLAAGSPGRSGNSRDSPPILPLTATSTVLAAGGRGEVSLPDTSAGTSPVFGLIWLYCLKSSRVAVASWSGLIAPTAVVSR
jgi:hypothetical protein